jgi:hypothetical protein
MKCGHDKLTVFLTSSMDCVPYYVFNVIVWCSFQKNDIMIQNRLRKIMVLLLPILLGY